MPSGRNIVTTVVINGIDNLSKPVARGAEKAGNSLKRLDNRMRSASYLAMQTGRATGAFSAAMAVPLGYAAKQALNFEDKMAGVAKVADVAVGSTGFKRMGEEVKGISEYLGRSAVESADLYVNLAQGGIAVKNLQEIATLAGEVGVAFNITSNEAGLAFAHIQNVLDLTVDKTRLVADAINELSNTRNAPAEKILTFLTSGGSGVARSLDIQGKDIAAWGATLIAMGKSGEEAATITERFAKAVTKSSSLTKTFNKAGGGAKGMVAILRQGLAAKNTRKFFLGFGEYGHSIELLARTMDGDKGLINALEKVSDTSKIAGSSLREFANFNSTTAAKVRRTWQTFSNVVITAGEAMLPVISSTLDDLKPLVNTLGEWVRTNPELTSSIGTLSAELILLSGAISVSSFAFGGLATAGRALLAFGKYTGVISAFSAAITTLGGVTVAALSGSVLAIGYILHKSIEDYNWFFDSVTRLFTGLWAFGSNIGPAMSKLLTGDIAGFNAINAKADYEANVYADRITGRNRFGTAKPAFGQLQSDLYLPKSLTQATYKNDISRNLPNYMAPAPLPYSNLQPMHIEYKPVMNFSAVGDPKEIARQVKDDFQEAMRQFQREQRRSAIE